MVTVSGIYPLLLLLLLIINY